MKNALNFIFLFLAVFPLTMYAQQEEFTGGICRGITGKK